MQGVYERGKLSFIDLTDEDLNERISEAMRDLCDAKDALSEYADGLIDGGLTAQETLRKLRVMSSPLWGSPESDRAHARFDVPWRKPIT